MPIGFQASRGEAPQLQELSQHARGVLRFKPSSPRRQKAPLLYQVPVLTHAVKVAMTRKTRPNAGLLSVLLWKSSALNYDG